MHNTKLIRYNTGYLLYKNKISGNVEGHFYIVLGMCFITLGIINIILSAFSKSFGCFHIVICAFYVTTRQNKVVFNGFDKVQGSIRHVIMKTHLYNFYPLKTYCYIVKLGFTGVYIIFLISAQNINCGTRWNRLVEAVLTITHNLCFENKCEKY